MNQLTHFFGLRRSGNHAVINWIRNNARQPHEQEMIFHNDVYVPQYTNPPRKLSPHDVAIESSGRDISLLLSYEDIPLDQISQLPTVIGQNQVLEDPEIKRVLLLRDPFNFFASRLQKLRTLESDGITGNPIPGIEWDEVTDLWKSYAKEFLGNTSVLGEDLITINYNRWVADKGYRDTLLKNHYGQATNLDIGLHDVPRYGEGSSFNGLVFDGRASEMDTEGRWKQFTDDSFYRGLFDNEVLDLSREVFGHISGTEQLLRPSQIEQPYSLNRRERY